MKIGITGTRSGLTEKQRLGVEECLIVMMTNLDEVIELHHGDCIGVDIEVAEIAAGLGLITVCHPPEKSSLRAYHDSDEVRSPLSYFARNRNIVDESEILLVAPFQEEWQSKGGTWYTHDYAKKTGKSIIILYPSGNVVYETG